VKPRGITVGRFRAVPIIVGFSWLLVIPLVGLALFAGIPSRLGPTQARAGAAGLATLLLFASVVGHELGHVWVAVRRGVRVERVVVFLFGGYSAIELDEVDPEDDMAISIAGPVASSLIALVTLAATVIAPEWAGLRRTLALLGLVNIGVALFNLLPGIPLDGGRIVRATLIGAGFERRRAGVITARFGVSLGAMAILAGVWMSLRGDVGSIVAIPVGVLVVVLAIAAYPPRTAVKEI